MTLTYNSKYNIAFIKFKEKTDTVDSLKISDELIIDIGSDGSIYGIELLNANEQIKDKNLSNFLLINEATGEKKELKLN